MKGARERASETTRDGCPLSTSLLYGLLSLRNQGYGGAERCADGGDAGLLEDEARGQGILRAHPGRGGHTSEDFPVLRAREWCCPERSVCCSVSCVSCGLPAVAPPTHAYLHVGGVDPQLSTEGRGGSDGIQARQRPARSVFVFGGWLLPLCYLLDLKHSLPLLRSTVVLRNA